MPTPFTHLQITQRLLADSDLPESYRQLIDAYRSAFQLGSIVADARVSSGVGREVTHFYSYETPITEHPWRVMLNEHPSLQQPQNDHHLMFLAGYVAHLATDEAWALKMVRPHFAQREWDGVSRMNKFIALHLLLTHMDERDERLLDDWQANSLVQCHPQSWLPFMSDSVLEEWRDLIYHQIMPDGISQTLNIFSKRLFVEPDFLRVILDTPDKMHQRLWQHIPRDFLADVEAQMYVFTRDQLQVYLTEYA